MNDTQRIGQLNWPGSPGYLDLEMLAALSSTGVITRREGKHVVRYVINTRKLTALLRPSVPAGTLLSVVTDREQAIEHERIEGAPPSWSTFLLWTQRTLTALAMLIAVLMMSYIATDLAHSIASEWGWL